jgi:hypothetical protein
MCLATERSLPFRIGARGSTASSSDISVACGPVAITDACCSKMVTTV